MLEKLVSDPVVRQFLSEYPQHQWEECLAALVLHSIGVLSRKYPFGLTLQQLRTLGSQVTSSGPRKKRHRSAQPQHRHGARLKAKEQELLREEELHLHSAAKLVPKKVAKRSKEPPRSLKVNSEHSDQQEAKKRVLREPSICSRRVASHYLSSVSNTDQGRKQSLQTSNSMLKIAEDFLKNPLTASISQHNSLFSATRLSFSHFRSDKRSQS